MHSALFQCIYSSLLCVRQTWNTDGVTVLQPSESFISHLVFSSSLMCYKILMGQFSYIMEVSLFIVHFVHYLCIDIDVASSKLLGMGMHHQVGFQLRVVEGRPETW